MAIDLEVGLDAITASIPVDEPCKCVHCLHTITHEMTHRSNLKYRSILIQLIQRGCTLRGWAMSNGYPISTVYASAKGARSGVRSIQIRRELESFVNQGITHAN